MVGSWLEGFTVGGFWWGVLGAIVYSIVSWALSAVVMPERRVHVRVERIERP
jgi:putative membrane protein